MKPLIIGLLLLGLIVFLLNTILKKPNAAELETNTQYGTDQGQQATPTRSEDTVPHFLRKPQSVEEQMAEILTDAHVTSDKYLQLVRLLETDESAVLAFLATRRYPENMAVESAEFDEVEMIARSMAEFYTDKPLGDNLEKVEVLRQTGPLFSDVVSGLLFAGSGAESAKIAYDWVMKNPNEPASLRSGATIGTILKDFAPKEAWSKASELPSGPIRTRAYNSIIDTAANQSIDTAIDYINSVEATTDLDPSISNVLHKAMHSGYPHSELVNLAIAPVDPVFRSTSLTVLFENWATDNPDSLSQWSQKKHEFPADQMDEINLVLKQTLQRHGIGP